MPTLNPINVTLVVGSGFAIQTSLHSGFEIRCIIIEITNLDQQYYYVFYVSMWSKK